MDEELKQHLDGMEARLKAHIDGRIDASEVRTEGKIKKSEDHIIERMRDMQTELLRGFRVFSEGQTIRLRKLEADQSNLDTATSGRVGLVEARLLQIELRLGLRMLDEGREG